MSRRMKIEYDGIAYNVFKAVRGRGAKTEWSKVAGPYLSQRTAKDVRRHLSTPRAVERER